MPIKEKIISKFFRGKLRSQFTIEDIQDLKGNYARQGKYVLCVPFFLFDAIEIDQDEAHQIRKSSRIKTPSIETQFDSKDTSVSVVINERSKESERRKSGGLCNIFLYGNIEGLENSYSLSKIIDNENYNESIDLETPFNVNNNSLNGGRVTGDAIIEFQEIQEYEVEEIPKVESSDIELEATENSKCIAITKAGNSCKLDRISGSNYCHIHQTEEISVSPIKEEGGCFGNNKNGGGLIGEGSTMYNRYMQPLGMDREGMNGCFSGRHSRPSGCFSPGLPMWRRRGCGCLSFLPLLLMLGLLYCLFFGDCGCKNNNNSQTQIPTHDTVYVEVVKEKIDTLKIVQMDTVSLIDSTSSVVTQMVPLPNVQFKTNSDILLPSSAKDLSKLAEHLDKNDSLTALIKGHTDSTGLEEYNLELSQRRAEAVKKYLVSLGIDPNRINAKGMGSAESKADNSTLEGRLMNRRVEVILESTIRKTRTIKPNPIAIDSIPITSDTSKNKSNVQ